LQAYPLVVWCNPGMRHINAEIKSPQHCSDSEIAAFSCFVRKGAEVDPTGLKGRIRRAKALAFLYVNRTLVGVAALKQPNEDIVTKCSRPQTRRSMPVHLASNLVGSSSQRNIGESIIHASSRLPQ